MELIEIQDIHKTYHVGQLDVPVLKGVSLKIRRAELVALVGSSGSGKTTLMNVLGCLDHPTSGRYWLDGTDVTDLSAKARAKLRNRMIGFVFQSFNLLARTSALDNVIMPMGYSPRRESERKMRERGAELLTRVGLGDRMDHTPSQLSGGQQQRVAIARALVNNPQILLADEPTGNLDSRTSAEILEMFKELNATQKITVILVTHDPTVAGAAQRTILLRDGSVESDTGSERVAVPAGGGVS